MHVAKTITVQFQLFPEGLQLLFGRLPLVPQFGDTVDMAVNDNGRGFGRHCFVRVCLFLV